MGNLSGEDMETLLAVFICKQRPEANRVRPSSGDNGIDLQVKNGDGTYDVYQVKKFAHTLKTSQKSQIKKSLKSLNDYIRETGYKVANWYLVLPLDPTPQNLKWFKEITKELPYHCDWVGLPNIKLGLPICPRSMTISSVTVYAKWSDWSIHLSKPLVWTICMMIKRCCRNFTRFVTCWKIVIPTMPIP